MEPELSEITEELNIGLEIDPLDVLNQIEINEPETMNEEELNKFIEEIKASEKETKKEPVINKPKIKLKPKGSEILVGTITTDEFGNIPDSFLNTLSPSIYMVKRLKKQIAELQILNFTSNREILKEFEPMPIKQEIDIYYKCGEVN